MTIPSVLAASTGADDALLFSLFVIFAVAKLAAEVFERIGQPEVVGEICAGVVIGPSVLGWVTPSDLTSALAEIGVILLLFTVGLEVSPGAILKVGGRAAAVALAGVIVPFAVGWGFMALWGASTIESVFIGAALVATSVGITARVLAAMNLLNTQVSQIILGAAVIDDILGLMVLSVVAGMAEGDGRAQYGEVLVTAGLSIGFTVFVLLVGTKLAQKIRPAADQLRIGHAFFVLALVLCLGLSFFATEMGVAAIIGAFLAGMALADVSEGTGVHHEVGSVMEFMVPFFLVNIGLQLDLAVFADPSVIALALVITLLAVLTKLVACGAAAMPLGFRRALQVGVGMVPRGEVGIIVAQIGLGLGVLSASIYGVVVFMAVATTLIAPPVLTRLFATDRDMSISQDRVVRPERTGVDLE
jgi:Kef-type K+ transport system membrane component KefB